MTRKLTPIVLMLFFLLSFMTFSKWSSHITDIETVRALANISFKEEGIYRIDVSTEVCTAPSGIQITNISVSSVDVSWEDNENNLWEYFIEEKWVMGGAFPSGSGNLSNTKGVTITNTNGVVPAALQADTEYEFWIRSVCGNVNSEWVGPFSFKTPCNVFHVPYREGFNMGSTTRDCWKTFTLDDHHETDNPFGYGTVSWEIYEGTASLVYREFHSDRSDQHDEWLISPPILLESAKVYRMSYKTYEVADGIKYDVSILEGGYGSVQDLESISVIKQIEIPDESNVEKHGWVERSVVIQGIDGAVSFVWNLNHQGRTIFYFDDFLIEEISGCPEPWGLGVKDISENSATILWEDQLNTEWEYWVQSINEGAPKGSGGKTNLKENLITTDYKGDVLEHTNEYEFYVRSVCKTGGFSSWMGPFNFGTSCGIFEVPYFEDFKAWIYTSGFIKPQCWFQIDPKGNAYELPINFTRYPEDDRWKYENNAFIGINAYSATFEKDDVIDDWLISPTIRFEANKVYRLNYQYRTKSAYPTRFEVLLSNSGKDRSDFSKVIVPLKTYTNGEAQEEVCFIKNVHGEINLAWHIIGEGSMALGIDNVSIEEVVGCPEPLQVEIDQVKSDEVTVSWVDDFGATSWEYYIQEEGGTVPIGSGIATDNKENIATLDGVGNILKPNTDYELYVRTNCGNGEYSIWQGPYRFTMACGVYAIPFREGFNSDSAAMNCWTVVDENFDGNRWRNGAGGGYEGDDSMVFSGFDFTGMASHDDWLISPTIHLNGGSYVLKYRYLTAGSAFGLSVKNSFEVLLSSNGVDLTGFSDTLKPSQVYPEGVWREEVLFFDAVNSEVNIAWHITSSGLSFVYIDDVRIEKVMTCPEPYNVEITGETSTAVDVEWEQYGAETEWEVIVVEYGEKETAAPLFSAGVTGGPKTTITGLTSGESYSVYIRAKCADNAFSAWSSAFDVHMDVTNIDCSSAMEVLVNKGADCDRVSKGAFIGAGSLLPLPSCSGLWGDKEIWFKFTALAQTEVLKIFEITGMDPFWSGLGASSVYGALYDYSCSPLDGGALECFEFMMNEGSFSRAFTNLQVGNTYYIRLSVGVQDVNVNFNLCLTSPVIEVSESGEKYGVEELVKEVLVDSGCDLVKNVRYQAGDGRSRMNTLGYFSRPSGVDFPFEEGLVLASHSLETVPGPYDGNTYKQQIPLWSGDDDLKEAMDEVMRRIGGERYRDGRDAEIAVMEFDFMSLKDSIRLEYLFASDSYTNPMLCKTTNSFFAAVLTDLTTEEKQNIALTSETKDPVSVATIRDMEKIYNNGFCESENPEYFWKCFDTNDDPFDAPINYTGMTIPMTTGSVSVVPGRAYKMTLIIVDFCRDECTNGSGSAVFINGKSLELGNKEAVDLGEDLLIATGTALCVGESGVLQAGIAASEELYMEIEWYKDGVLISGVGTPDLVVDEAGEYEVLVKYPDLNCEFSDRVVVEVYPSVSQDVRNPEKIVTCQGSLEDIFVDLQQVEAGMFIETNKDIYTTSYYLTEEEAMSNENPIEAPSDYNLGRTPVSHTLYIRVDNTETGCHEVFALSIESQRGDVPERPDNVAVCGEYVFPALEGNQYYYSSSGGVGLEYKAGEVLDIPGEHTIYVLQLNSESGCYEETSFKVSVTAPVMADVFEDVEIECELYVLEPLSRYNRYFTKPNAGGTELYAGMEIPLAQTIYIYAESEDGLCVDESSFTVSYNDCPIPRGISPNGDGFNDTFDLSRHGVEGIKIYNRWGTEVYSHGLGYTDQWYGQSKSGKELPDGTYYYVITAHGKTRTGWVQINR